GPSGGTGTGSIYSNGTFTLSGTGCCLVASQSDNVQFSSQQLNGDGTIIARLVSMTNFTGSAKAGLMIRETLVPESSSVFVGMQAGTTGLVLLGRATTLGSTFGSYGPLVSTPYWLELVRSVNTFTGCVQ